ncbi:cardiolipin synthase [Ectothiorhodospiraceae bacterium WFHF3C12]|nr:cardiolipin synthase [Ectothiorhodospiraceae bacterium WFHF3C12]
MFIETLFGWLLAAALLLLAVSAALHALLTKREPRAAMGWIVVCLAFPAVGAAIYFLFGINRIRTRAQKLQAPHAPPASSGLSAPPTASHGDVRPEFGQQAMISQAVSGVPLVPGNAVDILHNGEQAYPAMLAAIDGASERIFLSTYIFETNAMGRRFIEALADAQERGVDVRVLIDGVGEYYTLPRPSRLLRRENIPHARFLPPRLWPPTIFINLRNHRKLLCVDGQVAFTGGMNIGDRHMVERDDGATGVVDMHFRIAGPVVTQMESVFLEDWRFATGSDAPMPPPRAMPAGNAVCRTIIDGPNEDIDKLPLILVGAIAAARRRVKIMSPYFLPPREMMAALQSAALRGVEVSVVLPARSNLPFVDWATRNLLWELLRWGVGIYYRPGPFAHTKLFVVDDHYAQVGSANLDTRSLRLNFELVTEVYDAAIARALAGHIDSVRAQSRPVTMQEIEQRPRLERFRDAVCWLFSPYL